MRMLDILDFYNFVNQYQSLIEKKYLDINLYIQKAKRAFLKIIDPHRYLLRVTGNSL